MIIDKTKLKKSLSEVPSDCKQFIDYLKSSSKEQLVTSLRDVKSWKYGKCELYHWIDVLNYFDSIMEQCVHKVKENQWTLPCDLPENKKDKELLIEIILFTTLLVKHSSSIVYNSMEHLTTLLESSDMQIVLAVLNLLHVFSKRYVGEKENFISRLNPEKKNSLLSRLNHLADSWGGKENGFGLAECCQELDISCYPTSATTLHYQFSSSLSSNSKLNTNKSSSSIQLNTIHIKDVDKITNKTLAEYMEELILNYNVPKDEQMLLFTHLRLVNCFSNYHKRLQCVQVKLQALNIRHLNMLYLKNSNDLYNKFLEELVEVLELKDNIPEIKSAAILTLTCFLYINYEDLIINVTGASSYHGFLPSLVRSCIQALIDNNTQKYTLQFATALFSFLYRLANK